MATPKRGKPKRGAALAAAASAMAAAAADAGDDGEEDEGIVRTASGKPLSSVAKSVMSDKIAESTREPRSTIKRLSDKDGKYATLDIVDAALVNEEWIQRTYGGGKYRVLTHGPTQDGKWGYIANMVYEIDESVPFKGSIMGRRATLHNPDGSVVQTSPDNDMAMLMKTQIVELVQSSADLRQRDRESSVTMQTMMMNMMNESAKQSREFMQLMLTMMGSKPQGPDITALLGAITPLLTPLLGSRKDPIEVATQLLALTSGKGAGSQLSEVIAAVKELRETAELFGPADREQDDSLLGAVTRLAPQLIGMFTAQQQRELEAVRVPTAAPAPVPAPTFQPNQPSVAQLASTVPHSAVPEGNGMTMVLGMLKPYAGMLVERAMADDDPFDLGHSVALMIPVVMRDAVATFIAQEDAPAQVIGAIPELAPYPSWVNEFVEGVRERYNPTEEEEDEPDVPGEDAAAPGDTSHE